MGTANGLSTRVAADNQLVTLFTEDPRHESYGWVVVFQDLYGKK